MIKIIERHTTYIISNSPDWDDDPYPTLELTLEDLCELETKIQLIKLDYWKDKG